MCLVNNFLKYKHLPSIAWDILTLKNSNFCIKVHICTLYLTWHVSYEGLTQSLVGSQGKWFDNNGAVDDCTVFW